MLPEIVLSPYIPDGSSLLLRFTTKDAGGDTTPVGSRYQRPYQGGAPDSPSAAPSPYPSSADLHGLGLNANQLALLGARLKILQAPSVGESPSSNKVKWQALAGHVVANRSKEQSQSNNQASNGGTGPKEMKDIKEHAGDESMAKGKSEADEKQKNEDDAKSVASTSMEMGSLHPEDPIEARLRQITELLIAERTKQYVPRRQEKRQVIFVLANYFVLFLSMIAISAEIQARAPKWQAAMEQHLQNVQNCATDQDALYKCVSNGDFAGLIASVVLWISRSAATKRVFLFGFESPKKLWTVVYESLVTAVCWGFSYIFIRRGMNPDTHQNFLQKYWKDAVYGSLAGFNASFMKAVLKNLIPQEAIEDALQERQLKILSWLPSFAH